MDTVLGWLTPNEANAEIIPQTPGAQQLMDRGMADKGKRGETIRALHAQPEKFYLSDQPDIPMKLQNWMYGTGGPGDTGAFRPNFATPGYQINVNTPRIEGVYRNMAKPTRQDQQLNTLAHEAGHGLAQVTRQGGVQQSGMPIVDALKTGIMGPSFRIPRDANESLANAIAGINNPSYGPLTPEAIALAVEVMKRANQRTGNFE